MSLHEVGGRGGAGSRHGRGRRQPAGAKQREPTAPDAGATRGHPQRASSPFGPVSHSMRYVQYRVSKSSRSTRPPERASGQPVGQSAVPEGWLGSRCVCTRSGAACLDALYAEASVRRLRSGGSSAGGSGARGSGAGGSGARGSGAPEPHGGPYQPLLGLPRVPNSRPVYHEPCVQGSAISWRRGRSSRPAVS